MERELRLGDVSYYQSQFFPSVFYLVIQNKLKTLEFKALCTAVEKMYIMAKDIGIRDIAITKLDTGIDKLSEKSLLHALFPFIRD